MGNDFQPSEETLRQAMRMADTDAGRALIDRLKQSGGSALTEAMKRAARGDYTMARTLLTALMEDPQTRRLLGEMEATDG